MTANQYFKENLLALRSSENRHMARAKWSDGEDAYKTSIYQVFEKYSANELPIHTYRETAIKSAIQEMLWIYKDQSSCLDKAHKRGITWWDDFKVRGNTIGCAYGEVVSRYNLIDNLLSRMIIDPYSQRHILSLWDESSNNEQYRCGGLVPCAFLSQFNIIDRKEKRLINQHLQLRSSDYITAGAINRIQYYCLGLMVCGHLTKNTRIPHIMNDFSVLTLDMHIYDRHEFAFDELLSNGPIEEAWQIKLNSVKDFYDYELDDFEIIKPKGLYELSKKLELAV